MEVATHCSILAWEIPWTEDPGGGPWDTPRVCKESGMIECTHTHCAHIHIVHTHTHTHTRVHTHTHIHMSAHIHTHTYTLQKSTCCVTLSRASDLSDPASFLIR